MRKDYPGIAHRLMILQEKYLEDTHKVESLNNSFCWGYIKQNPYTITRMSDGKQLPPDFVAEENDFYDNLPRAAVAIYKFFDLFKVDMSDEKATTVEVAFGKAYMDEEVPRDVAKQIRNYVKEQKRKIRQEAQGYSAEEGRRKIYWLLTMLLQYGVFSDSGIGRIQSYAQFVFHETKEEE
jgi:hypothetical protein